MAQRDSQKARERADLGRLLWSLGEREADWELLQAGGERPDFVMKYRGREVIGIELSDLISTETGEFRRQDTRVCRVIESAVSETLRVVGGGGAIVFGHNSGIPKPSDDLKNLGASLSAFLDSQAGCLSEDNGKTSEPFSYEWGEIECVWRVDTHQRVDLIGQSRGDDPAYKDSLTEEEIEQLILLRVNQKVTKAGGYECAGPIWLGLMNRNRPLRVLSEATRAKVSELNKGKFGRIILCNCPFDESDPRPPHPTAMDLVTGQVYRAKL